MSAFLERIDPPARIWIFGGGHVAAALAPVLVGLDFQVIVVDERAEWADPARFPAAVTVRDTDPQDLLRRESPRPTDHALVVTHDHGLDETLIRLLAPHPLAWLGLVGSRGKWARFRRRLEARDLDPAALDRVRCPVGADIGAVTPAEIAVSIAADLVAHRHKVSP
ncbi:MAG: XdhC family protein [Myxococcales bacterium]|nr:XdhC family protein [Myxococcales bacterium]